MLELGECSLEDMNQVFCVFVYMWWEVVHVQCISQVLVPTKVTVYRALKSVPCCMISSSCGWCVWSGEDFGFPTTYPTLDSSVQYNVWRECICILTGNCY